VTSPVLALRELEVRIDERTILRNLSLELRAGEGLALLGASGSGKSTLLKYLSGEHTGSATVSAAPRRISYSAQTPLLYPWMSVLENLMLGRPPSDLAAAQELLQRVGLAHAARLRPTQLSGGMRARACLARSFMPRQELVLLDEPFASLDPVTAARLRTLTRELLALRTPPPALLLVSHDLDEALALGDQIKVLAPSGDRWIGEWHNPRPEAGSPEYQRLREELFAALSVEHPFLS